MNNLLTNNQQIASAKKPRNDVRVPKLRFKEFEGDWKQLKIENILKIGSGRDYKHLNIGKIPVYGTGGLMTYVDKYLYEGESVCIGRKGTIDKPVYLNEKFWTVDTLFYTHSFTNSIPKFIFSLFQKINWKLHNEASGVPSLSKKTIENIKITIPKLLEQQKIATFLTAVETKLQQLNSKKSALETYKKGAMQQLFSEEIRFKSNDGSNFADWEEKKLGEVCEMTSSKRVYLNDYVSNGIPFYRGKEISELRLNKSPSDILFITKERYEDFKFKYGVPLKNDILITAVGTLGNVLRIRNDDPFYFKDGNLIWLRKHSENPEFLEILLAWETRELIKTSIGSTQKALTMVELRKLKFNFPSLKEQQKIATYLSAIDTKIEYVQQQIKKTQVFKKGLLQQLFV